MLKYHMLVRQDTHGNRYLVESKLSEAAASERLRQLTAGKPHKQSYDVIAYKPGDYAQIIKERFIIE